MQAKTHNYRKQPEPLLIPSGRPIMLFCGVVSFASDVTIKADNSFSDIIVFLSLIDK
jgi:hypothetical protein